MIAPALVLRSSACHRISTTADAAEAKEVAVQCYESQAGLGSPHDHALIALLAMNGPRISEALGAAAFAWRAGQSKGD